MTNQPAPPPADKPFIAIPGSLTDFAKALRELIGAFQDAAGLVTDGIGLVKKLQAGQAADKLDSISFRAGGFCRPLERIAAGQGTKADIDELERLLPATKDRVLQHISALKRYRDVVRRKCGAAAGHKLSELLVGPSGKFVIRDEIDGLVWMARDEKSVEDQQAQATKILKMIAQFNADLVDLHDTVFPPEGAK